MFSNKFISFKSPACMTTIEINAFTVTVILL